MSAKFLQFPPRSAGRGGAISVSALALCCALGVSLAPMSFGHGAIDERIAELLGDLKQEPNDPMSHFMLADAYTQHEDWVGAFRALVRVEELAPGKFDTDLMRGRINLGAGRVAEARVVLDRFLAAKPFHRQALALRAQAFAKLGDDERCLTDYHAALELPGLPEADLVLEAAGALADCGHEAEAVEVLSAGIEKLGPGPELVLRVMDLEILLSRYDDALARVDVVQQAAPRPEPWMARRATLLEQSGRTSEALAAWKALAAHLATLPSLERGSAPILELAAQAQRALGHTAPRPVFAPPASQPSTASTFHP